MGCGWGSRAVSGRGAEGLVWLATGLYFGDFAGLKRGVFWGPGRGPRPPLLKPD